MAQQRARSQYFPGGYDYDASDDEEDYGGGFILTPRERANLEAKRRQDVIEKRRREQQEVRSRLIEEERKRRAKQEEFYRHLRGDESVSCDTFNWPSNEEGTNCSHQPRPEVSPVPSTSSNTSPSTHQSTPIDIHPRSQTSRTPSNTSRSPSPSQGIQKPATPISAETTTPATSPLSKDEAAIKIQTLYRARRSMRTIKALESQFDTLKAAFVLPSTIDFQDPEGGVVSVSPLSSPSSSNDTPGQGQPRAKLAYTATNVSLHTYVESLNRLLVALDGVESWGVKDVRESRKGVVRKVEKEAEEVDELWRRVWETYMKELKEEKDVDLEMEKSSVNSGADEEQLQGEREEQEVVAMVVDKVERGDESNVESHAESTLGNGLGAPDDEPAPVPESDCLDSDSSNPKQENNSISTSSTNLPSVQESAAPSSSLSADPSVSSPSAANIDIVDSPLISNLSDSDSVSDYGLELLTPLEKPDPLIFIVDSTSGDIGVGSEEGKEKDVDVASLGAEKQNADLEEDFVML